MNLKCRYCCVVSAIVVVVCVLIVVSLRSSSESDRVSAHADDQTIFRHYVSNPEHAQQTKSNSRHRRGWPPSGDERYCRLSTCFDLSRCRHGFTVHIHPSPEAAPFISYKYSEILKALRSSRYYTDDPERACIFVLGIDTLDRDRLSTEYVPNIRSKIESLRWWRGGVNHVVFNQYSGTWPDYNEDGLGFNVGRSMLAKASTSRLFYRPGFDISFPLFHREHRFYGGEPGALTNSQASPIRRFLLSFKGKRYLVGIGSETRNSLYHIHNGEDIILLTTCKHGKGWKNVEDQRCETDNLEYERFAVKLCLLFGLKLGFSRILDSLCSIAACFGSIYAFGYNSVESEPIWMKFWTFCRGLDLADFGCNTRSSNSWTARQNLFFFVR